jgi:hypothetical protein
VSLWFYCSYKQTASFSRLIRCPSPLPYSSVLPQALGFLCCTAFQTHFLFVFFNISRYRDVPLPTIEDYETALEAAASPPTAATTSSSSSSSSSSGSGLWFDSKSALLREAELNSYIKRNTCIYFIVFFLNTTYILFIFCLLCVPPYNTSIWNVYG